ncbi:tRNA nucleotidyltransferase [Moraxella cuniculi]|uniref:Multifunctional CCA protein n=1 Tax=Moraxella cuniculi TaxID=34061 RepID=A0A448GW31_9GAMM|nr:tRNA nucleotidyltransferase [Moraxella cuniculi]VEG13006.1 Multifunctional CCA protein [Moraxella cuniculi]
MQIYLVGGAVRDMLLGLPVTDKDFVVVGGNQNTMLSHGFRQVGADFPVFLHPDTHNEYALARLERKSGTGHRAFCIDANESVRLQDDLLRRDLTINALAIQVQGLNDDTPIDGTVVDFYGGLADLHNKILRHVSPAFSEDPLRVLRVARFYARLSPLGFVIDDTTCTLMTDIASRGELATLSRERIWAEFARALMQPHGHQFISCLQDNEILLHILPTLAQTFTDNNSYAAVLARLQHACKQNAPLDVRFAMLFSNLYNNKDNLNDCLTRLNAPKAISQFVHAFANYHKILLNLENINAEQLLTMIEHTKAHKDDALLMLLYDACQIYQDKSIAYKKSWLNDAITRYQSVSMANINPTLTGKAIGDELTRLRLLQLTKFLQSSKHTHIAPNQGIQPS